MSEIITKGYLINVIDYELFDQIITFINEYGNVFSCIAIGSRKIKSKNARQLKFGALLEFDFFMSRNIDKVGRLKKVVALDNTSFSFSTNNGLIVLNQLFFKAKCSGKDFYNMYLNNLELLKNNNDQNNVIIKIFFEFMLLSGIKLKLNGCSICNNRKIINFDEKEMGFVCIDHNTSQLNISPNVLQILYAIHKNKLSLLDGYSYNDKFLVIKFLMYLINSYIGINLYSLLLY